VKEYLLLTSGYHLGGMITHFFLPRHGDFMEMALHHLVAIYLMLGSYMFNAMEISAVIAFLHDIADITTNIVKCLTETNDKFVLPVTFMTHMAIWFYTRMVVLPWLIWKCAMFEIDWDKRIMYIFTYLLSCMCILHYYWFAMFCKMLKKFLTKGATEDT